MIRTKRGLDLPISGEPTQLTTSESAVRHAAVVGYDYPGLKPTMEVQEGDQVKAGQLLFTDKKTPGVQYTAPAAGKVVAINRGPKRIFESLVIQISGKASRQFASYDAAALPKLDRAKVVENLLNSGQWCALRTRPYSKVPAPGTAPQAMFVTAADTRPLAPDPALHINDHPEAWLAGIDVVARLTEGKVYVCSSAGASLPTSTNPQVVNESFAGPHPAGNVGTHIHFLHPIHINSAVWHIGYQDLVAIGYLFTTGKLFFDRLVSIAGPGVASPRLVKTRLGAATDELTEGSLAEGEQRIVSGSVLDGRRAQGVTAYLGRFHNQVSVLPEGRERELLQFVMPGANKYSLTNLFAAAFMGKRRFPFSTSTGGSPRSIIPLGTYEQVMPMDILPVQLLKALVVNDFDASVDLGCLELDEEDLALCTFVCPGKYEYGPYLRRMLTRIEAEN